jgi:hypothetical protein
MPTEVARRVRILGADRSSSRSSLGDGTAHGSHGTAAAVGSVDLELAAAPLDTAFERTLVRGPGARGRRWSELN